MHRKDRGRARSKWVFVLGSAAVLTFGCDDIAPVTTDAGPLINVDSGDAAPDAVDPTDTTARDAQHDEADASSDVAGDAADSGDVGCACSPFDAGIPISTAEVSLPCYCARDVWPIAFAGRPPCGAYADLLDCSNEQNRNIYVDTYTNCDLVTVGYGVFNAVDLRVYDGTTHALVGALRADDGGSFVCDPGNQVNSLRAGVLAGSECEIAKTEQPCRPPEDAGDAATDDVGPSGD